MDKNESIRLLKKDAKAWSRAWKAGDVPAYSLPYPYPVCEIPIADLRLADLRDARLEHVYLEDVDLTGANLTGANLFATSLRDAILNDADFTNAQLVRANLSGAIIDSTRFVGARLHYAILSDSTIRHADFSSATCEDTHFARLNLSDAIGLDAINHEGPSHIDIATLILSKGKIPTAFLEGCGIPDNWITYLPSLLGKTLAFYSCFISFSHADEDFTKRLHSRMREDHLRVWYSPENIKAGRKIHEQIDTAIKLHDKLLVVLSDKSMSSEWVKTEVRKARRREVQEGKRVLFPISLVPFEQIRDWEAFDADTGKDMAVELREYFIPDFSEWKDHDKFEAAYQRLMRDLKPTPEDG